ncbi:Uncharacterised protein [Mycobacterium tuberculosis]|nr:Uncharacterised protein [Mycobacterium tuberculosis]
MLELAPVHPRQQTQRKHIFGALAILLGRADRLDGTQGQCGHGDGVHHIVGQLAGLQRVCHVAHFRQVALGELVRVHDHHSAKR